MRRFLLTLAAGVLTVGGLAAFAAPAMAHDRDWHHGRHGSYYHGGWHYRPYAYPAYRTYVAPAPVYSPPAVIAPAPYPAYAPRTVYPAAPGVGLGIQTPGFSLFLGR